MHNLHGIPAVEVGDVVNHGDPFLCWCGHYLSADRIPENLWISASNVLFCCGACGGSVTFRKGLVIAVDGPDSPYCYHGYDARMECAPCPACQDPLTFSPFQTTTELH